MNIILNNYCNLNCSYCFANEVTKEKRKEMTIGDFKWLLNFLKKSNSKKLRLIGGEPTLHPLFADFVLLGSQAQHISKIVTFTNGLYPYRYNELFYLVAKRKPVEFLINFNDPEVLKKGRLTQINRNLEALKSMENVGVVLGINFYKLDQNYKYIIEQSKKINAKTIRWSLVVPNSSATRTADVAEYFFKHIPQIIDFIRDAKISGLEPSVDCNNIPLCMLDDEQLRLIAMLSETNLKTSICQPVIDVKPDLQAIRCFAMSGYSTDIKKFDNEKELNKHFVKQIDKTFKGEKLFTTCENCATFQLHNRSCACLAYQKRGEQ